MSEETKTPKAGEYWASNSGLGLIAFIVGICTKGDPVWQQRGSRQFLSDEMDFFLSCFHHEPRCTGFDWVEPKLYQCEFCNVELCESELTDNSFGHCCVKCDAKVKSGAIDEYGVEPPAVDPGEGWELLPKGTVLKKGDHVKQATGEWLETCYPGECVGSRSGLNATYRRKIKPEVWPKWYVHCDADRDWCVERFKEDRCRVHRGAGVKDDRSWIAMYDVHIADGMWREVTEADALARVKPPEPEFCVSCGVHSVMPGKLTCGPCIQRAINDARCPVESPDDWVEISKILHPDHIPRPDIDVLLGVYIENNDAEDRSTVSSGCSPIAHNTWDDWKFVCRRKDLPAPVPAVKRVPVRLWINAEDGVVFQSDTQVLAEDNEIKIGEHGFYIDG